MADEEKKDQNTAKPAIESTEEPASAEATTEKPSEEKTEPSFAEATDGKEVKEVQESFDKAQDASAEAEEKVEEKVVEAKEEKPAPSGKFKDLIKQIETMTVADLAELVKALEDRFGVSAAMPMAVAGAGAPAGAGVTEAEEKSSYTVVLKDGGAQKIAAIKAVREINQDLGLKEAKDLVDGAPKEIKKDVPKADAEEAKKKLEAAGATVELV